MHGPTVRAWQKDAENVRAFLAALGPSERMQCRVSALLALAFIKLDAQGSEYEPVIERAFEVMYLQSLQLTKEDSGRLSLFLLRQMQNQKNAHASPAPMNQLISAGIPIWIVSFRAIQKVEVLATARAIWALLDDVDCYEANTMLSSIAGDFAAHRMGEYLSALQSFETPSVFLAH